MRLRLYTLIATGTVLTLASIEAHDPVNSKVTWTSDIERLVHARCIGCHVDGGRGPMSLVTYEEARPWARAMREEVLTRRMPKWHAARGYGQFANDRSLSPFEIALMVAWVDGGAVRGPRGLPNQESPSPIEHREHAVRHVTTRCGDQPLTRGRLLAIRPRLHERGSAGFSLIMPDGSREVLAWIQGFEKKFEETYWLHEPIEIPAGARLSVEAAGRCSIVLMFAK